MCQSSFVSSCPMSIVHSYVLNHIVFLTVFVLSVGLLNSHLFLEWDIAHFLSMIMRKYNSMDEMLAFTYV